MTKVIIGVDPTSSWPPSSRRPPRKLLGSGRFNTEPADGLAQRLLQAGQHVVNVPTKLAARVWLFDTGHNRKTDARDAHSLAIVAVRTTTLRASSPRGR
jgi:transposase